MLTSMPGHTKRAWHDSKYHEAGTCTKHFFSKPLESLDVCLLRATFPRSLASVLHFSVSTCEGVGCQKRCETPS